MQAGRLRWRVTLQKMVQGQSTSGAATETPETVAKVWAEMIPDRGSEAFAEEQRQGWSFVMWRIRAFARGLDQPVSTWQLIYDGKTYEILDVRPLGYREGYELVTRTRAEDQAA